MEITVKHEVPNDKNREDSCLYAGDFFGNELCKYHTKRDRKHGKKAPIERQCPKCKLFDVWLSADYKKCEECKQAIQEATKEE